MNLNGSTFEWKVTDIQLLDTTSDLLLYDFAFTATEGVNDSPDIIGFVERKKIDLQSEPHIIDDLIYEKVSFMMSNGTLQVKTSPIKDNVSLNLLADNLKNIKSNYRIIGIFMKNLENVLVIFDDNSKSVKYCIVEEVNKFGPNFLF